MITIFFYHRKQFYLQTRIGFTITMLFKELILRHLSREYIALLMTERPFIFKAGTFLMTINVYRSYRCLFYIYKSFEIDEF